MFRAAEKLEMDDLYIINGKITAVANVLHYNAADLSEFEVQNLGAIIGDYSRVSDEIVEGLEEAWAEKKALERQAAEDATGAKPYLRLQAEWNAEFDPVNIMARAATG